MRTIETDADLTEGLGYLLAVDRRLKKVAAAAGPLQIRRSGGGFAGLARIVTGQQLSVASARAIWSRFVEAFPEFTPEAVARAREPRLRRIGLSGAKIKTIRAVAAACRSGLDLDALADYPAEQAHARLCEIHGIGSWTADIYLLFCLGHPDIFPAGDLALRNAVADALQMEPPVTPLAVSAIAEKWSPWRSVAATLFWAYYGARRAKIAVPL